MNDKTINILKLTFFSLIGLFVFFVPITLNTGFSKATGEFGVATKTIFIDHIVNILRYNDATSFLNKYYLLVIFICSATFPFIKKTWNNDITTIIFTVFKVLSIPLGILVVLEIGPSFVIGPGNTASFLFYVICIPIALLIPIGAVFLAFITGYGLLEFIGTLARPVMKPLFKTSGRSAIDAVASFVGSYSIGLLITNQVYRDGKYNNKEATIIATGFSTVSATFMVIVAKTTGLMDNWNLFFWSALVTTFFVTFVTVRIFPLRNKEESYFEDQVGQPEEDSEGFILKAALDNGLEAAGNSSQFFTSIYKNLLSGINLTLNVVPTVFTIGFLGLILADFTPIFDIIGLIFVPFALLAQVPEALEVSQAIASGLAEMFLPALAVSSGAITSQAGAFVIGITSISQILFFSAAIPCILNTDIKVSLWELMLIWVERVILSILVAGLLALLIF